jgi:hypothetical protein
MVLVPNKDRQLLIVVCDSAPDISGKPRVRLKWGQRNGISKNSAHMCCNKFGGAVKLFSSFNPGKCILIS